jgi:methionyl-tRNA synthetase
LVACLDRFDITGALEEVWVAIRRLNQHVEANAPWELAKDEAKASELDTVLYDLADGLCAVAVAVSPYLPETAPRILDALGQPADLSIDRIRAQTAETADGIEPAPPLFPRVEEPTPA